MARRVLSVASESAPLVKTGGLADVVGALPSALLPLGWESRVLMPAYPGLADRAESTSVQWETDVLFGGPARVLLGTFNDVEYLLLDAPHFFDREGGPYNVDGHDYPDNHVRFAALSWVGSRLAVEGTKAGWVPEVVHAHDWQAGLVPSYLKYAGTPVPSVMTLHNIAFQGIFGPDQLDRVNLPTWDFHPDALEYHGTVSALKAGMVHASAVNTVSPSYARQIASPEWGFGLDGVIRMRAERGEMFGILNGIDLRVWDPENDPHVVPYSASTQEGKRKNRKALIAEFGLAKPQGPLAVVVTRLAHQKGIDMLIDAVPDYVARGGSLAVLGSGDPGYESALHDLARRFPGSVGVRIGYDEPLSHRMYAGGDSVLVPSRFEPCGLTQMYGLRYGAVPIVAATGGLKDSVTHASAENIEAKTATGITFSDISTQGLSEALAYSTELFALKKVWRSILRRGMRTPVGWESSARVYAELFERLTA
ncbi:glycogen synthase GlgA [Brevibacterium paucivorans]